MPNMELIGDFQIGQQRSFPQQIWLYVWDDMYTRENDFCVSVCVCVLFIQNLNIQNLHILILPNIDPVMEQNKMFFTESQRSVVI